ncbi:DUF4126 domain-containing protein [Actinotalea sp.]|uniref:DUF4126 domain-containing protein n=1 Tax=Actinotalea sp. TaxID=1872145 RepID=UPI00356AA1A9
MLELLTGTGLATAAGLNAALPLLVLGVLDRWTPLVSLPEGWSVISSPWVLALLALLLVLDVVADKVPGFDHANDVVQSLVRPAAGGVVFGAGTASATAAVPDPAAIFAGNGWAPVAMGALLALAVHLVKALARPIVTASTAGLGTPVVSTAEDVTSLALSLSAVLVPVLVAVLLGGVVAVVVRWRRRHRRSMEVAR